MACEYCHMTSDHHFRCPLAPEPKFTHYCSICGEGIGDGEEYIENDDGKFAHLDCSTVREMIEFLGYKVKVMESEDDEY